MIDFNFPSAIATINEAKEYLKGLWVAGYQYHPEDPTWNTTKDEANIVWGKDDQPTKGQCLIMDKLMNDIYNTIQDGTKYPNLDFDPCTYLLDLERLFLFVDLTGRGIKNKMSAAHLKNNAISILNLDENLTDEDEKNTLDEFIYFIDNSDLGEEYTENTTFKLININ